MSPWSASNAQLRKEKFWRTKPPDPTQPFRKAGVPYYAKRAHGSRSNLTPSDFMPIGPHAGKHLHAVPPDYLLWVNAQPWSRNWVQWHPIADFISRFLIDASDSDLSSGPPFSPLSPVQTQLIYVDPIQQWPTKIKCFQPGSSHLHTLPGHLDLLQTFGIGALALNPDWFQHKECPHFDLTIRKHQLALQCGAVEIPRRQFAEHLQQWRQFRNSQPKFTP